MKDVCMLFSKAMNKWLEDFTINDGGASFGDLALKNKGERYELLERASV